MKKFMMILLAILITTEINSSNLCWGYPKDKRLIQIPIQKNYDCTCECWKYSKTKGDNNHYICTKCLHRLTPEDVLISKSHKLPRHKYKRWEQGSKKYHKVTSNQPDGIKLKKNIKPVF